MRPCKRGTHACLMHQARRVHTDGFVKSWLRRTSGKGQINQSPCNGQKLCGFQELNKSRMDETKTWKWRETWGDVWEVDRWVSGSRVCGLLGSGKPLKGLKWVLRKQI